MQTLHDLLTISENAKFLNHPHHIEILSNQIDTLTIRQVYDAANVLEISPAVLVVKIISNL
jgi:hypothetical protein